MTSAGAQRRLRPTADRIGHQLVDDAVAIDENGAAPRSLADPRRSAISQCPGCAASSGCETSACHTTAWNDSTSGVFRSAGGIDDDRDVGQLGQRPAGCPDHAVDRAPRARGASSIALTMLTETLCSREPPPTLNTSRARRRDSFEIASHSVNDVSQPSSLVRAVSSETLSVGA